MGYYIPALTDFGDDPLPLDRLLHRNRHYRPQIRESEQKPTTDEEKFRILQRHCSRRGKRHEFVVETREGLKCMWCGIVRAEPRQEIRA